MAYYVRMGELILFSVLAVILSGMTATASYPGDLVATSHVTLNQPGVRALTGIGSAGSIGRSTMGGNVIRLKSGTEVRVGFETLAVSRPDSDVEAPLNPGEPIKGFIKNASPFDAEIELFGGQGQFVVNHLNVLVLGDHQPILTLFEGLVCRSLDENLAGITCQVVDNEFSLHFE